MAIDETRKIAYVIHELKSLVVIFSIDPHTGDLVRRGAVDILEHSPIPVQNHTWPYQVNLRVEYF
jgi:6-phosphogluconolactonase (cycloisomerase 2 family)